MTRILNLAFRFWMVIGKLVGLMFIDLNKEGNFYCIKYYNLYSIVVGVSIIVWYPIAYVEIIRHVSVAKKIDTSLATTVSVLRDCIDYAFMISAFLFHNVNRNNMENVLNEVKDFVKNNRKDFVSEGIKKYEMFISAGVAMKFAKIATSLLTFMLVSGMKPAFALNYLILFIPKLTLFVVSIECYIGVTILKYHMDMLTNSIIQARRKMDFRSPEKLTMLNHELEICDFFDKMSLMHSKLFKIYKTLSGMYQFQLLLLLLSNYFSLMIDMFYVFHITCFAYRNIKSSKGFHLRLLAIVAIITRCCDTLFVLKGSSCTNKAETSNCKLLTHMNYNGRDQRLKETVS